MSHHYVDPKLFCERLKELRIKNNLTQKQLAEKLKINERTYQRIETGKFSPSYKTILAIINVFGLETYNHLIDSTNTSKSE